MPDRSLSVIETPEEVNKHSVDPLIFTMPEKYRGLAVTQKSVTQKTVVPFSGSPVVSPPAPVSPKAVPSPLLKSKMARSTKILLIAGGVFILGMGGTGIYFVFLRSQPAQQQEIVSKPVVKEPIKQEQPKPVVKEEPSKEKIPVSPFPKELLPGRDTDSDGLTDVEEVVFGTNSGLPDSDADGYLDGNEVSHGYNPKGTAPTTLLESGAIKEYAAPGAVYRFFYPIGWTTRTGEIDPLQVILVVPSGETVTVTLAAKNVTQSLIEWYTQAHPERPGTDFVSTTTKKGYPSLLSKDQMTAYVDAGTVVAAFFYQSGTKTTLDYLQTFQMILNSLILS
ncbi:MAG: hypothetical protein UU48_C0001G0122 [Candidatus Uhrbacteria bacterium GW2011_GWF2_41_16]|uniref:Thrombospondin type 3 repeat superfamily protein n=2 Tax=Candidatus Uhriibacteriota TaxID=1752732 RepID=A0A0G0YEL3_9BACT|nr:MAG: hypothetical protein UU31_C0002G0064 [Candidatus Uhrbacteria bacterium GW2011_GWA2_41_10]KKR87828.1 MAG: hypothetical protein UU35_C0001G0109 [Candidatus Uhrbacteria bacterium GW2011_GWC2_41_11]KKR98767.1 MAG: hypothetical protein UU48_C0001G0122 [Candidatus Uhrbacteria bacterium GW2011_GWF2_41_16]HBP00115.1 hypothetical protein [Candidatus Uhrbacteria bacterium]